MPVNAERNGKQQAPCFHDSSLNEIIHSNPGLVIFVNAGWSLAALKRMPDFEWADRRTDRLQD